MEQKTIKILLADDDMVNQMIVSKSLKKINLTCNIVNNGEDVINKVKHNNYNVVLMDINMPKINGINATKTIRTFNKDVIIIALTATVKNLEELLTYGFTDFIEKPFKIKDFQEKLQHIIKTSNLIMQP